MTFKHSGDIGDLIYSLPVIRQYGEGVLYLNPKGIGTKKPGELAGLNPNTIRSLTPLLMRQPYIKAVKTYTGQVPALDLDAFRVVGGHKVNQGLCAACCETFGVPVPDDAWMVCGKKMIAPVVINRTTRYRNNSNKLKKVVSKYKTDAVFVGLADEYESFVEEIGDIRWHETKTLLDVAEAINGAELFIGNQSSPMAIAIALGKPFIQEVYTNIPNCVFDRADARYIV